jgi:uncharacterized membrane protein (UPF0127 family)
VASATSGASPAGGARNETRGTVLAERLEVASSLWAKFLGLMGRATLPAGAGMWLPASNGIHMFFMRMPIDAVFVGRAASDGTRRVLSVHRSLKPWIGLVPFIRGADGVLELPAGTVEASGTERGDAIRVD